MAGDVAESKLDSRHAARHTIAVADDDNRSASEILGAVAANVAAVPLVLGFVALGGVVLAGRALVDVAGQALGSRQGKQRTAKAPASRPPGSR